MKKYFFTPLGLPMFAMNKCMEETKIGSEGTDPVDSGSAAKNPDTDPADPEKNDLHTPGDGEAGQTLNGTQASTTQQRKEDNIDDEWDAGITQFQPWRNPLLSIARKVSRKVNISNWEINHARIGGDTLDGHTTVDIPAGDSIQISSKNYSGSVKAFYKNTTICVPSVPGYKDGSKTEVEGGLVLYVTGFDAATNTATCVALNGPAKDGASEADDTLDKMTVPAIPAGTYMCAGASATSESQLMITPENYQPRREKFYVQKKLLNLVWTNDFAKSKKKINWGVADIKAHAIYAYNLRAERTYWYSVQRRFQVTNADGSVEDVYTTKGVLWQITNSYAFGTDANGDTKITLGDLIALSKLQHTTFSQNDHSYGFCGKDAMEWLLKVDMGENQRIVNMSDVRDLDIDFKRLKTTFGTTDFTYDPGLDALGLSKVIVILDLEGATRYVKSGAKEATNDMSKGSGEIREAKRLWHYEADGIALRGFNSIIAGPTDTILGMPDTAMRSNVVSASKLPAKPTKGVIIALTADYTVGTGDAAKTYEAGTVLQYDGAAWAEYKGYTTAV